MAQVIQMITAIRDEAGERLYIPSRGGVDTQSNLNSDLCFELMASLGLDSRPFETKKALIDYSLLAARNSIAHGEYLDVTKSGYEELHDEVVGMLDTVKRIVIDAAENKRYRKTPTLLLPSSS
jgi:hypothetical protein